jgi:hypothetical protein
MRRFDQPDLLENVAGAGALSTPLLYALSAHIAAFHEKAEPRRDRGGSAGRGVLRPGTLGGLRRRAPDRANSLGEPGVAPAPPRLLHSPRHREQVEARTWLPTPCGPKALRPGRMTRAASGRTALRGGVIAFRPCPEALFFSRKRRAAKGSGGPFGTRDGYKWRWPIPTPLAPTRPINERIRFRKSVSSPMTEPSSASPAPARCCSRAGEGPRPRGGAHRASARAAS